MRPIQIDPLSALVGAAVAGLALLAAGFAERPSSPARIGIINASEVSGIPTPTSDFVVIKEGQPFTVPVGKILVFTAIGSQKSVSPTVSLRINGELMVVSAASTGTNGGLSMARFVPGIVALEGDLVTISGGDVSSGDNDSRVWGYLADV